MAKPQKNGCETGMEGALARGRTAEILPRGTGEVIKLFYGWCPADWASREAAATSIAQARGLPVPECGGTTSVDGRQGVIFERIQGPSLLAVMMRQPWRLRQTARLFARLHARIHEQSGEGLPDLRPYLEGSLARNAELSVETREYVSTVLSCLPDGGALCHFDFHPDQILISPRGPVVIDWMAPFRASAAADVARTLVLIRFATSPDSAGLKLALLNGVRGVVQRAYLREYARLRPQTSRREIDTWMIPVAAARLTEGIGAETRAILEFIQKCRGARIGLPAATSGTSGGRRAPS